MKDKSLYLIDASSFIYRGFFALPPLTTKDGFPTGAIYGFLRALLSIMKSERPEYLVVVFDHPAPTKRDSLFKEYKAGRPSMPDPLIIAILAKKFSEEGFKVKIYTPDKDMLQLVDIDLSEDSLKLGKPNMDELRKRLSELEMKSILKDLEKVFKEKAQGTLF